MRTPVNPQCSPDGSIDRPVEGEVLLIGINRPVKLELMP